MLVSYSTYIPDTYGQTISIDTYSSSSSSSGPGGSTSASESGGMSTTIKEFDTTETGTHTYTFINQVSTAHSSAKETYTTTTQTTTNDTFYTSATTSTDSTTSKTTTLSYGVTDTFTITTATRQQTTTITQSITYTQKGNALTATMVTIFTGGGEQIRMLSLKNLITENSLYKPLELFTDVGNMATFRPDMLGVEVVTGAPQTVTMDTATSNTNKSSTTTYSIPSALVHTFTYSISTYGFSTITTYEPVLYPPLTRSYITSYINYRTTTIVQSYDGIATTNATTTIDFGLSLATTSTYTANTTTTITHFYVPPKQITEDIFSSRTLITTIDTTNSYVLTIQNTNYLISISFANYNTTVTNSSSWQEGGGELTGHTTITTPASTIEASISTQQNITITVSTESSSTKTEISTFTSNFTTISFYTSGFSGTIGTDSINSTLIQPSVVVVSFSTTKTLQVTTETSSTTESNIPSSSYEEDLYSPATTYWGTWTEAFAGGGAGGFSVSSTNISYKKYTNIASISPISIYYPLLGFGIQKYNNTQNYFQLTAASTVPYPFFATVKAANILTPILYNTTVSVFYSNEQGMGNGYNYSIAPSGNILSITYAHETDTDNINTQTLSLNGEGVPAPNMVFILNENTKFCGVCGTSTSQIFIIKPRGLYRQISNGDSSNSSSTIESVTQNTTVITNNTLPNLAYESMLFFDIQTYLDSAQFNLEDLMLTVAYSSSNYID